MGLDPADSDLVMDDSDHGGQEEDRATAPEGSTVPKAKRLACTICRKRKLRCDGSKPSCSTCTRLGHICAYDEVRRKSGPKRGYVKALEERLKQVETLLKTQEPPSTYSRYETAKTSKPAVADASVLPVAQETTTAIDLGLSNEPIDLSAFMGGGKVWQSPSVPVDTFDFSAAVDAPNNFSWELIGLGLEEPLPPQETMDELHQIYFDKIHPSMPMIQRFRYMAAMNLAPNQRPPVCLRYIMWTLAAGITDKYASMKNLFYQRARKYLESDYIKGFGESMISVAHAQTHVLLAQYEFKMMYFPRAWMSTGAAVRMTQMMGLHRLDGLGLDVKQCLPPARDWTELEERRRTFWMAFTEDRYASIGTGWPMIIDEKDILTNMPCSDDAFNMSREESTGTLADSMTPAGATQLSALGGIILLATLFGRNLVHLHRPDVDNRDHDLNGDFWKRHRNMDNILLNTSLCLPPHLKLPQGISNPNIIFTNMCIHTSTICLHQAAIFKADKHNLPPTVSSESKIRCITAANEITSIMRTISHVDLSTMNPFLAFCLYVAARVFVQYLKSRPDDSQSADCLRFILAAMNALKRKNPLTESFLVQLDIDLEALAARYPKLDGVFPRHGTGQAGGRPQPTGVDPLRPNDERIKDIGSKGWSKGLSAYSNECHFMKTKEDNGDLRFAPPLTDTMQQDRRYEGPFLGSDRALPHRYGIGNSPQMGGRSPAGVSESFNFGPSGAFSTSDSSNANDVVTTPSQSTDRPTPGSNSERTLMSGSSRERADDSFRASPAMANIDSNVGIFLHTPSGDFTADVTSYSASAGIGKEPAVIGDAHQTDGFPDASFSMLGWPETPTQNNGDPAMTPGSEGVLRNLMQMDPMEAVNLGWGLNS